jgi:alpha-mannosidase
MARRSTRRSTRQSPGRAAGGIAPPDSETTQEALPGAGLTADAVPGSRTDAGFLISKGVLHLVGHAHIDPVWLWQWQEGFQEIKQTWRSALERMREYPEFRFSASSAAFYEWIEHNEPPMFEEIRARVAEGRWELAGGWWVEPDCNIPSGESFARHALYGQRYFQSRFGRHAQVGFNPDAFGHSANLPKILAGSGLASYVFMRPQVHEMDLPRIFRWRADDGSEVLAFRILWEYGTWVPELERWIRRCSAELSERTNQLLVFYGVGNHGGGPTRANIESLRALDGDPELPRLERSTMTAFFEALREHDGEWPVVEGELQRHAPGCYSSHSGVKRWNRHAESLLLVAERWSALGEVCGGTRYPIADLTQAWKDVLFNQFHDVLAGTAIQPAYEDVRDLYGASMTQASRALNHATQAIASRIAISQEVAGTPIVCFNPHAWPAKLDVELEYGTLPERSGLTDEGGSPIAMQAIRSQATVRAGRSRISFLAEPPPLGYRVYRLVAEVEALPAVPADDRSADNGLVRAEVDPGSGAIRVFDHRLGEWLVGDPGLRAVVLVDSHDTWGHGLDRLDQLAGVFQLDRVRQLEQGPVRSVIRIESSFEGSHLVQDVIVRSASDRIEVRGTLTWNERWRSLKLRVPVGVLDPVATFEAAYGTLRREPDGREVPGQRWVDVTGTLADGRRAGLTLLNDSKHGFDVTGSELGMTVVRSPVYAHHEPYLPLPGQDHVWQDQGGQQFRYLLVPHEGHWTSTRPSRAAAELNEHPITVVETLHGGDLPLSASFASTTSDHVDLVVLKRAEDGRDLVVRLVETIGEPASATLELPALGRSDSIQLNPWELQTLVVPRDPDRPVRLVDLVEWPVD